MRWQALFAKFPFPTTDDAPWSILSALDMFLETIEDNSTTLIERGIDIEGPVYLEKDVIIEKGATIIGPAYIASKATIRQGAYIRGGAYIGSGAIVGHATEIKHAVFLPNSHAPHFNYVGDSVLGQDVNLGAGVKISNFKNDGREIVIGDIATGMRKIGAFIGDGTKIGCNAVTAPGTIIGKNCLIYPLIFLRGIIPADSIIKLRQEIEIVAKQ